MGYSYARAPSDCIQAWRAPADSKPLPTPRRVLLSATDRHGDKAGSFPCQRPPSIEHGLPRLVPDARGHFPVLLKHARRKGSHACGLPHKIAPAYEPHGVRQEVREQDRAKAFVWRKLDAQAYVLTEMD